MLSLPPFTLHRPRTLAEAVELQQRTGGRYLAGGTDLLPNLKHGLDRPDHLISLRHIPDLFEVTRDGDRLVLGACTSLHEVHHHPHVVAHLPALADAAGLVAGPQHRHMGTLGGNVMLDTRCIFLNQSESWREAAGGCLKAGGDWCHVVGSDKACVAAQSSDTVPVLVAANARVRGLTPSGPFDLPIRSLYGRDGRLPNLHQIPEGSLITSIELPPRWVGQRSAYRKVRSRAAVDFPQLSVAVLLALDDDARLTHLDVVLGALLPQPRHLRHLDRYLGLPLDDGTIEAIADHAQRQVRPQEQVHSPPGWRRHVVPAEVRRALRTCRTTDPE